MGGSPPGTSKTRPFFEFLESFLQRVYNENTTAVEHAGQVRGHSDMVRGVRQGCLANVFLFTMTLDPIFRWLEFEELEEVKEGVWLEPISFPLVEEVGGGVTCRSASGSVRSTRAGI